MRRNLCSVPTTNARQILTEISYVLFYIKKVLVYWTKNSYKLVPIATIVKTIIVCSFSLRNLFSFGKFY